MFDPSGNVSTPLDQQRQAASTWGHDLTDVYCSVVEDLLTAEIGTIYAQMDPDCRLGTLPRSPNMPYQHCLWNCRLTLAKGELFAIKCSDAKELVDLQVCMLIHQVPPMCLTKLSQEFIFNIAGHCCSAYQPSDFKDNAAGRYCGSLCQSLPWYVRLVTGCAQCCQAMGVGPNVAEGSGTSRPYGPHCTEAMEEILKEPQSP
jgi:hypothetical protein